MHPPASPVTTPSRHHHADEKSNMMQVKSITMQVPKTRSFLPLSWRRPPAVSTPLPTPQPPLYYGYRERPGALDKLPRSASKAATIMGALRTTPSLALPRPSSSMQQMHQNVAEIFSPARAIQSRKL